MLRRKQFIRHQIVERTQARSKDFHTRVVRALLHMRVFIQWSLNRAVATVAT